MNASNREQRNFDDYRMRSLIVYSQIRHCINEYKLANAPRVINRISVIYINLWPDVGLFKLFEQIVPHRFRVRMHFHNIEQLYSPYKVTQQQTNKTK